jgi:hypothetical protein
MQSDAGATNMSQVQSLLKRPALYDNIDGVGELAIGFMCLGYVLYGWLNMHAAENSVWQNTYAFLAYVAVMLSIIHFGGKAIKNRITYRRTGFVAYRRDKYWVPMAIAVTVSVLVAAGMYLTVRRHWDVSTPVLLIGLGFAALYIGFARTVRWKWAMFAVMVAGPFVIAALPADIVETFANHTDLTSALTAKVVGAFWLTFLVYGAVLMVSGGISFWLYIRHTQAPAQEGQ